MILTDDNVVFQDIQSNSGRVASMPVAAFDTSVHSTDGTKKAMLIEILDKSFRENPWCDLSNLEELMKQTGLDDATIKVLLCI